MTKTVPTESSIDNFYVKFFSRTDGESISTSFWVLPTPESWPKYFLSCFEPFLLILNVFRNFSPEIKKKRLLYYYLEISYLKYTILKYV